ncbi:hypothetical protein [Kribbella monticola]|uniref:hypothetical protein n=1 Tax=Kribbella monticola TaxID=2185285 RepID=UPI0013005577|nr:hypothetical protein [Kribbella monticola]
MLTARSNRWHIFSITIAAVFLIAMLTGAIFAATERSWVWLVVLTVMAIFQLSLIVFILRNRSRPPA